MNIRAEIMVAAPTQRVWEIISNIENAQNTISGIQALEILEKPESGLVGLKWEETRTMFGKAATEIMWITKAEEGAFYETRAESHGAIYTSRMAVEAQGDKALLSMEFGAEVQTVSAKIMWALTGWMAKGAMKKTLMRDLEDIKAAAESK